MTVEEYRALLGPAAAELTEVELEGELCQMRALASMIVDMAEQAGSEAVDSCQEPSAPT